MDLIDRQALLDTFDNVEWYSEYTEYKRKMAHGSGSDAGPYIKWDDAIKTIEAAPTVEPKRGKWIMHKTAHGKNYTTCSNCNSEIELKLIGGSFERLDMSDTNFCPYCGADMRDKDI